MDIVSECLPTVEVVLPPEKEDGDISDAAGSGWFAIVLVLDGLFTWARWKAPQLGHVSVPDCY